MTPIAERPSEVVTRSRALGGRSHQGRPQWVGRRDPGGTEHTLGHPGQDGGDGDARSARVGFTKKLRLVPALLRQYLPKGTDLSGYTQRELNAIAHRLNTRPRKCLNFATPLEVYAHLRHHSPVALGT